MKRFCTNCGKEVGFGKFCAWCGESVSGGGSSSSSSSSFPPTKEGYLLVDLDTISDGYAPLFANPTAGGRVLSIDNSAVAIPSHGTGDSRVPVFGGSISPNIDRLVISPTIPARVQVHSGREVWVPLGYRIAVSQGSASKMVGSENKPLQSTAAGSSYSAKSGPVGVTSHAGRTVPFLRCVFAGAQVYSPAAAGDLLLMQSMAEGFPVVMNKHEGVKVVESGNNPAFPIGITAHGSTEAFSRLLPDPINSVCPAKPAPPKPTVPKPVTNQGPSTTTFRKEKRAAAPRKPVTNQGPSTTTTTFRREKRGPPAAGGGKEKGGGGKGGGPLTTTTFVRGGSSSRSSSSSEIISSSSEQYRLGKELGAGAFGVVREATRLGDGQKVAIKFLAVSDKTELNDCLSEGTLGISLKHKNVLETYEVFIPDGNDAKLSTICLVMRLYTGGNLTNLITSPPSSFSPNSVVLEFLEGLVYLHNQKVVHRDLKPDNILLNGHSPVIADFGVSKKMRSAVFTTQCGTPLYMAPELDVRCYVEGTNKTDVWSAGLVVFQILTRKKVLELLVNGKIPAYLSEKSRGEFEQFVKRALSPKYVDCIPPLLKMLAHDPGDRTTAKDAFEAFKKIFK